MVDQAVMEQRDYLSELLGVSETKKELLAAVIGLVRASVENGSSTGSTAQILTAALAAFKNEGDEVCAQEIRKVRSEKVLLAPDCAVCANPCKRTADYPMDEFCSEPRELQEMKAAVLFHCLEKVGNDGEGTDFEELCRLLFLYGYEKDAVRLKDIIKTASGT